MSTKLFFSKLASSQYGIKVRKQETEKLKNFINDKKVVKEIAPLFSRRLKEIQSDISDSIYMKSSLNKIKTPSKYIKAHESEKAINVLNQHDFFNSIRRLTASVQKNNSGENFFKQIYALNEEHQIITNRSRNAQLLNFEQLYSSTKNLRNVLEKGGHLISFDIESTGGTNLYGHHELNAITELIANVTKVTPGSKNEVVETMGTVFGYTEDEVLKWKSYLKNINPYNLSEQDKIFLQRHSIYGDPITKIVQNGTNTFEYIMQNAPDSKDVNISIEAAERGIDNLHDIYLKQKQWLAKNAPTTDYKDYRTQYVKDFNNLIAKGQGKLGTYENFVTTGHNTGNFDINSLGRYTGETFNIEHGRHLDTYQAVMYLNETLGRSSIYPDNLAKNTTKDHGIATLEQIAKTYGYYDELVDDMKKSNQAIVTHTAAFDQSLSSSILLKNAPGKEYSFFDVLEKNIEKANEIIAPTQSVYKGPNKQVFLMNNTLQKNKNNKQGILSFSYNPLSNTIKTYEGFEIGADGKVIDAGYQQYGPKANTLYSNNIYKIDFDAEGFKEILKQNNIDPEKFFQEYQQNELYLLKSVPFVDKEKMSKSLGTDKLLREEFYTIFTSLESTIQGGGTAIAEKDDEDNITTLYKNVIDSLNISKTISDGNEIKIEQFNGTVEEKFNAIVERSMNRQLNDPAARTARNLDYDKYLKYKNFVKTVKEEGSIHNALTKLEEINTMSIAERQASGQAIDFDFINSIGLNDGRKYWRANADSQRNAAVLFDYFDEMEPLLDSIYNTIEKSIPINDSDMNTHLGKELKAKRNFAFKYIHDNIIEEIANGNIDIVNNYKDLISFADELNVIDFNMEDIFPDTFEKQIGGTLSNPYNNIVSLDLNRNDGLVSMFFKDKFANNDMANKKGHSGYNSLVKAYDIITQDERFGNIFSISKRELEEYAETNVDALNDILMTDLKNFVTEKRTEDTGFGLLKKRQYQDYINPSQDIVSGYSNNKELIDKKILSYIDEIPKDFYKISGDKNTDAKSIKALVDNILMPLSEKEFKEQIKDLPKLEQDVLMKNYKLSLQASTKRAEDIVKAVSKTDVDLILTKGKDKAKLIAMRNGQQVELNLFSNTATNGVLTFDINGSRYVNRLSLDGSDVLRNGYNRNIKLASSIESASKKISFETNIENALLSGEDILDALVRTDKKLRRSLSEETTRIDTFNAQSYLLSMGIDVNDIAKIIPELEDSKTFSDMNVSKEARKAIQDMSKRIKKARGTHRPVESFEDLMPTENNFFYQNYLMPLMNKLGNDMISDTDKEIVKAANVRSKDTLLNKGWMGIGQYYPHPLASIDKEARPPITQMGNVNLYDNKKIADDIAKHGSKIKGIINNGKPIISGTIADKYLYNVKDSLTDKTYTGGLSLKYLQVDTDTLRSTFAKDVNMTLSDKDSKDYINSKFYKILKENYDDVLDEDALYIKSQKLAQKAMQLSTYEQQGAMNSRIHDIAFHKDNSKLIDARKELVVNHKNNLKNIETVKKMPSLKLEIKDGKVMYLPGEKINAGDYLMAIKNSTGEKEIISEHAGALRLRYFNKLGQVVSEADLQKVVDEKKLTRSVDIYELLDGMFDKKYEFIYQKEKASHKISLGPSEKATIDSMKVATGKYDPKVKEALLKLKLKDEIGVVHQQEYLDSYLFPLLKNKGMEDIIQRIENERHLFSDVISQFEGLQDIGLIVNMNSVKHKTISMPIETMLYELNKKGVDEDKIKEILNKNTFIKDGTIYYDIEKNTDSIDTNPIFEILGQDYNTVMSLGESENNVSYGYATVHHIIDDSAGTFSGATKEKDIYKQINKNKIELDKIDKQIQKEEDPKKISQLIAIKDKITMDINNLDLQAQRLNNYKGLKFSDRMNLNLNRVVYNEDTLINLQNRMQGYDGALEELKDVIGHLYDADGNLNTDMIGRSVLDPLTSNYRRMLLEGNGGTQLKDSRLSKYNYLKDVFGKDSSYSIEKAEMLFAWGQGNEAMLFNENPSDDMEKYLKNLKGPKKFVNADLSDIDIDFNQQGDTIGLAKFNPYNNNLIINTGLDGEYSKIAIGRSIEKYNDDSFVKNKQLEALHSLKRYSEILKSDDITEAKKEDIIKIMKNTVDIFKQNQKYDINSKEGLMGQLTETRLDRSFFGKASGLVISILDEEKYANMNIDDKYKYLKKYNPKILDDIYIGDKTFLKHYSEGKVFDIAFASEDAFKKMGYFDKDYMNNMFSNMDSDMIANLGIQKNTADLTEQEQNKYMRRLLSKYGDTMMSTRFPEIQEGSDKLINLYLNDELKDNQIQVYGPTGMAAKLDHDGDNFVVGSASTKSGKTRLDYTVNKLNADTDLTNLVTAERFYMTERATAENLFFDKKVRNKIKDEMSVSIKSGQLQEIANERIIDGKIFTGILNTDDMDYEKLMSISNEMKKYTDIAKNKTNDNVSMNDAVAEVLREHFPDKGDYDEALMKYATAKSFDTMRNEVITAKVYKQAIGETNVTNYKVKTQAIALLDKSDKNYKYNSNLIMNYLYLAEEGAISSKSSTVGLTETRAQDWNRALKATLKGEEIIENSKTMKNWLTENVLDNVDIEYFASVQQDFAKRFGIDNIDNITKEQRTKILDQMSNDIIGVFQSLSKTPEITNLMKSMSAQTSSLGVGSYSVINASIPKTFETTTKTVFEAAEKYNLIEKMRLKKVLDDSINGTENFSKEAFENVFSKAKDSNINKPVMEAIAEGAQELFKAGAGNGLAIGAIGVAAAVMSIGFVGGRPRPADTQALELTEDESPNGGVPQLVDSNMSIMPSQSKGYVININAKSEKSKEQIITAVQQAMRSGASSNINIAMNINEDKGNINDRYIDKIIAGALR